MVKSYTTKNPSQTRKLGEKLAKKILKKNPKKAVVIGLVGELGGGKTTFLQGFARGLGIKQKILSPTFVIMRKYEIPRRKSLVFLRGRQNTRYKIQNFYHIDCYRIRKPKEILALDFKEIISNHKNIVAVEWAERIKKLLSSRPFILKFEFVDKLKRKIIIESKND